MCLLLCTLFYIPLVVNAKYEVTNPDCSYGEKIELRNEASKITYVIDKYAELENMYYMIEILNLSPAITIEDIGTPNIYRSNNGSVKILKAIPGITKKLVLFVNETSVCNGYKIFSKNIIIPYYNKFKDHELCVNNKEHTLCKENSSIKITEEEFIRVMNDYIKEKNKKPVNEDEDIPEKTEVSLIESMMDFLARYYIYILLGIIAIGTIGIVAIQMNKRRSIL